MSPRGNGERTPARSSSRSKDTRRSTPALIIASLAKIVDQLGLPHPLHIHCNNLGAPGNVATTIETMKVLEGRRAHLAHLQFHAYDGDDWDTMRSGVGDACRSSFNTHEESHRRCRRGALRRRRVTITADGPFQHAALSAHRAQVGQPRRRERDTAAASVRMRLQGSHLVNAVQWAVGLEPLLLIDDLGGFIPVPPIIRTGRSFWRYPEIIRLLMDVEYRRGHV